MKIKKITRKSKVLITSSFLGLGLLSLASTATAVSFSSREIAKSNKSSRASDQNHKSDGQTRVANILKSSSQAKQIIPNLNTRKNIDNNLKHPDITRITFLSPSNAEVLKVTVNQGGDMKLITPEPLKMHVSDASKINNLNFNIGFEVKSFNKYAISNEGFSENETVSSYNVGWKTNQLNTVDFNVAGSKGPETEVVFDYSEWPKTVGKVSTSQFGEIKINLLNDNAYAGDSRIAKFVLGDDAGNTYEYDYNRSSLNAIVYPSSVGGKTKYRICIADLLPENTETTYKLDFQGLNGNDKITASNYLNNQLSSPDLTITNQFSGFLSPNNFKIFGYANDELGELNIIFVEPYIFVKNGNTIVVSANEPKIITITGFSTTDVILPQQQHRVISSKNVNMRNHALNYDGSIIKNDNSKSATIDFGLSPFYYSTFSLKGNLLIFKQRNELKNGNRFNTSIFRDKSGLDFHLADANDTPFGSPWNQSIYNHWRDFNLNHQNWLDDNGVVESIKWGRKAFYNVCLRPYGGEVQTGDTPFSQIWTNPASLIEKTSDGLFDFNNYSEVGNSSIFDRNVTIQGLNTQAKTFNRLTSFLGVPMPKFTDNHNPSSMEEYVNKMVIPNVKTTNNVDGTSTSTNLQPFYFGKNAAFPTGQILLYNDSGNQNGNFRPMLFDTTNLLVWINEDGSYSGSYENTSIFTSKENLEYNLSLGLSNNDFGRTRVGQSKGVKNYGVSNNSRLLPSQWIANDQNLKQITFELYNSLNANKEDAIIELTADDNNGTVQVSVIPKALMRMNDTGRGELQKHLGSNNLTSIDDLTRLTSSQMVYLTANMNVDFNRNPNGIDASRFQITGFKALNNNKPQQTLGENYLNPSIVNIPNFALSKSDLFYNYNALGSPNERTDFAEWLAANVLTNYVPTFIYFDPTNGAKRPNLFVNNEFVPGKKSLNGTMNKEQVKKIIKDASLTMTDKFGNYTLDINFQPNATFNQYNDLNKDGSSLKVNLNTDFNFYNYNLASEVNVGLGTTLANDFKGSNPRFERNKFIDAFKQKLLDNSSVDNNLLRFYAIGFRDSIFRTAQNPNDPTMNFQTTVATQYYGELASFPYVGVNGRTENISVNAHPNILYNGKNIENGYQFQSDGTFIRQDISSEWLDVKNWTIRELDTNYNEGSILVEVTPSVWSNETNSLINNTKSFQIKFSNIVPKLEKKTTTLTITEMAPLTTMLPKELHSLLSNKATTDYTDYVNAIKNNIENIPDTNATIEIEPKPFIDDYTLNRYIEVNVYIKGSWYNNSLHPVPITNKQLLGVVRITPLQIAKVTTMNSNVNIGDINQLVENNTAEYALAQNYYIKTINGNDEWVTFSDKFNEYLRNRIFTNPGSNTVIKWSKSSVQNSAIFDNKKGTLTFSNTQAKIFGEYYDVNGVLQPNPDGINITVDNLVLEGFKMVNTPTTIRWADKDGNIDESVVLFNNIDLVDFTFDQMKTFFKEKMLLFYPDPTKYPSMSGGANVPLDDFLTLDGFAKDFATGSVTFNYTLKRYTSSKMFPEKNFIYDYRDYQTPNESDYLKGSVRLSGFKSITAGTTANALGYKDESFVNQIATAEFNDAGLTLNQFSSITGVENNIIDRLVNSIINNNGINNLAPGVTANNIQIAITEVDNLTGQIRVKVKMDKYYKAAPNGGFQLYDNPGQFEEIPETIPITLFKTNPGESSVNPMPEGGFVVDTGDLTVDNATPEDLKQIIYDNANIIFANLPSLIVPDASANVNAKNSPYFTKDNIIGCEILRDKTGQQYVTVRVTLDSFFKTDPKWNTVCWSKDITGSNNEVFVSEITLKGFGYKSTSINSFSLVDETMLLNKLPSQVFQKDEFVEALKQVIFKRGISGGVPNGTTVNNLSITGWNDFDNLKGTIILNVSLNSYFDANGNPQSPESGQPLNATITISGFRQARTTTIKDIYNGQLDPNINSKFAYEFTQDQIIQIVYDYLVNNTPDSFTIGNISLDANSIQYDNIEGSISFIPILDNYFDEFGQEVNSPKKFNRVKIIGFKTIGASTSIEEHFQVQDKQNALAISQLNYSYSTILVANDQFKQFVLENFIVNGPSNLTIKDIKIDNIVVNNSTGSTAGITAEVRLNKWIDQKGDLIVDQPLTQRITIGGYGDFGPTSVNSIIPYTDIDLTGVPGLTPPTNGVYGAKEFQIDVLSKPEARAKLEDVIFNNIKNKWGPAFTNDPNAFNKKDFKIANIKGDNLSQCITLDVGLFRYVDEHGTYKVIKTGTAQQPLIKQVKLTGFRFVKSSEFKNEFRVTGYDTKLPQYFTKDENLIKRFVFNQGMINKLPTTTEADIRITKVKPDNKNGTLIVDVSWNNNYYDYKGKPVTNEINDVNRPQARITIRGFKSLTSPTSCLNSLDVRTVLGPNDQPVIANSAEILPSTFALYDPANTSNKELIQKVLMKSLVNAPEALIDGQLTPMFDFSKISITPQIMSDGQAYYGKVNNNPNRNFILNNIDENNPNPEYSGTLTVTFEIPIYYNDELELVDSTRNTNAPTLSLTTILWGFKANPSDLQPTTFVNTINLDVLISNPDGMFDAYKNMTSNDFSVDNLSRQLIIQNGIRGWDPKVEENEKLNLIKVTKKNSMPGQVTVGVQIQNYINEDDGILSTGKWSPEHEIDIIGFKEVAPTSIESVLNLSGLASPRLSNYAKGTLYEDVNVWNLNENDIATIIHSKLLDVVKHATANVERVANQSSLLLSDFSKYIRVSIDARNGLDGVVNATIQLSSFYNDLGNLIEGEFVNGQDYTGETLTRKIRIIGFARVKNTIINQHVTVNDSRSPSELFESPNKIIALIQQYKEKFFKDLPSTFNFNKSISIIPVSFNNISGTLKFDLTITHYFDEFGAEVYGSGIPMTAPVTVTGFKRTRATEMTSQINIVTSFGWTGDTDLVEITAPSTIQRIKDEMIKLQNDPKTPESLKIWKNLPKDKITSDDFSISIDKKSINFSEGSVDILVSMDSYYDANGILVNDRPKTFPPIKLTGFKKVTGPTTATTMPVSIKGTELENWTSTDPNLTGLGKILPNISESLFKTMFTNLPSNATLENIVDVQIMKDPEHAPDQKAGTLWIEITLNNYFEESPTGLVQKTDNKKFQLQLSGFARVDKTSVNPIWDISSTTLAGKYVNNVSLNEIESLINNDQDLLKRFIVNPVIDANTKLIETRITTSPMNGNIPSANKNGPNGTIDLTIKLSNFYEQSADGSIVKNEQTNSQDMQVTLTGFRPLPVTEIRTPLNNINGDPTIKPSEYASSEQRIIDLLNQNKDSIFNNEYGATQVNIIQVVNPNITSIEELNNTPQADQKRVFVDDSNGIIKLRFKYVGGYNVHGEIDNQEKLSPVITFDNFEKASLTSWKNDANVTVEDNGRSVKLKVDIKDLDIAPQDVQTWDGVIPNNKTPEMIIRDNLEPTGDNNLVFKDASTTWTRIPASGRALRAIDVDGWAKRQLNKDLGNNENPTFTDDSVLVSKDNKITVYIELYGFLEINLSKQQTSLWILIGTSAGLFLLILIALIGVLSYKRRFH